MPNPLDPIIDNYKNTREAFKVIRECVMDADGPLQGAFASTKFSGLPEQDALDMLQEAEAQLQYLTVLALFSTFERRLRDELASKAGDIADTSSSAAFEQNLPSFYERQCDYFPIRQLLQLFIPDVEKSAVQNDVWPIKEYRDWIAHGRSAANTPKSGAILADDAYDVLTDFLTDAQLI